MKIKPVNVIEAELGIDPNGEISKFFTDTCYNHMDKYVPMRPGQGGGSLRNVVDKGTDYITYEMYYAQYQYPHQYQHYSTPGTGPYWDRRMVSAEMQDVIREVQEKVRRDGR